MRIRIMASRHSAFYSPLLSCIHLLRSEGHDVPYSVLQPGQRSHALIRDGEIDVMQSAVSSNWNARERGVEVLPVHFAQINRRDGFFLVARAPEAEFKWKHLEGRVLLADHGLQPLTMLKYAAGHNGVDWQKVEVVDAGDPDSMIASFAAGRGDYIHLQAPIVYGEIVVPVGASMPPVAFSSLCCAREFQSTEEYRVFLGGYSRAREWVRAAAAEEVAAAESAFFPDVTADVLAAAIRAYQKLGCWEGGLEIPRDLYEQALDVFQSTGAIASRHPYEEVVHQ
jgi:NitT/TauT family transport system substrate-binding protein